MLECLSKLVIFADFINWFRKNLSNDIISAVTVMRTYQYDLREQFGRQLEALRTYLHLLRVGIIS